MNIQLENKNFSISINTKGAELNSFKNQIVNKEYIWEGNPEFWGKHSPILFPIVGALKNDSYYYNDKKYNLSRHGFARDFEFEVIEKTDVSVTFSLKENDETLQKYPFQFELQIKYVLTENKLVIIYHIKNNSKAEMPFNIGAHPAFALPKNFTNYSLEFEKQEELITHELENNLFSGGTRTIALDKTNLPLNYSLFEKDALVFKTLESKSVKILDNGNPFLKVNYEDFSSLGIWTVKNASFICIEPWIGFADEVSSNGNLFDKKNIQILEENSSFEASFSIEIL
ncbi:aldose 1-epimerase family protein [Flavobacterium sp.]|jgi:galactose mutarotase-like enzyme|uniref:aldose 1-epimerase family protein n=1 Tax=Flavobacterium sp. TaxID=239 RepID=UPI0037BEA4CC